MAVKADNLIKAIKNYVGDNWKELDSDEKDLFGSKTPTLRVDPNEPKEIDLKAPKGDEKDNDNAFIVFLLQNLHGIFTDEQIRGDGSNRGQVDASESLPAGFEFDTYRG
jgi:hypothetical protein